MNRRSLSFPLLLTLLALTASAAWAGGNKVQVCHVPPGNPSNFHTITISEDALPAHLAHGDLPGTCFAHCDTLCSDGNPCTIDACDASEHCLPSHPPVNCDDSNPCTTDSCDPVNGCMNVPKSCANGDKCAANACDPMSGSCVATPILCPTGQSCNPANGACEGVDLCANVVCPPFPREPDCQPGICSAGVCGFKVAPDGTSCAGGLGTCVGGDCTPIFHY